MPTSDDMIEITPRDGSLVLICEHASNAFPPDWGDLGLTEAERSAHIAYDPGALALAEQLAILLDATLISAKVSRLIYDLNRPPHSSGAMPETSERHAIAGNRALPDAARIARTTAIYVPFHNAVRAHIAERLAARRVTQIVTVHSFTPVYFGAQRETEFGVIHDLDSDLAHAIVEIAQTTTSLKTELNQPYSAADEVTHTLALHATAMRIPNAMLEIRNDLIATSETQAAMAQTLAPVLRAALARLET
jgi:predicted N-formylglutamate amidohydrolase